MAPYQIDSGYLATVQNGFTEKSLLETHPVLDILKHLHFYTFNALVKAYDWYTFGDVRRLAVKLTPKSESTRLKSLTRQVRKAIQNNDESLIEEVKRNVDRLSTPIVTVNLVHDFLLSAMAARNKIENSKIDFLIPNSRDDLSAMPAEFWIGVCRIYDCLANDNDLRLTADTSLLALLSFYYEEERVSKIETLLANGREHVSSDNALDDARHIGAMAVFYEEAEVLDKSDQYPTLDDYLKPFGDTTLSTQRSSYLMARMAVAAHFYRCYFQLAKVNGHVQKIDAAVDFANWLFHWLWRNDSTLRVSRDEKFLLQDFWSKTPSPSTPATKAPPTPSVAANACSTIFNIVDKYAPTQLNGEPCSDLTGLNDINCKYTKLQHSNADTMRFNSTVYSYLINSMQITSDERVDTSTRQLRTEYLAAEDWHRNLGAGVVASFSVALANFAVAKFVKEVWGSLLTDPATKPIATVAAASKLGVAYCDMNSETNGSMFFNAWGVKPPHTYAVWRDKFDARAINSAQKKSMTDVILSIGKIAHMVTGITENISHIPLVDMARRVYFKDPTQHAETNLLECGSCASAECQEAWIRPWGTLSSDTHITDGFAAGLPHVWLYGANFLQAVEAAIKEVSTQHSVRQNLAAKGARWSRLLLCIPWNKERRKVSDTMLADYPEPAELKAMIKAVFVVTSPSHAAYPVSQNLKPIRVQCQSGNTKFGPLFKMPDSA